MKWQGKIDFHNGLLNMSPSDPKPTGAPPVTIQKNPVPCEQFIHEQVSRTRRTLKIVDLATSLIVLVAGLLGLLLLVAMADHWVVPGGLGMEIRFAVFFLALAASLWYGWKHLWPHLVYRVNPVYAAQTIERSSPSLKNSLLNLLLFGQQRETIPEAVYHTLEHQAAERLKRVTVENAVDRSRLIHIGYLFAALVVLIALYKILSPKDPFVSARRIVMPWAEIAAPSRVSIENVDPGTDTVTRGEVVTISAMIRGLEEDEDAQLRFTTDDRQAVDQSLTMHSSDGLHFQCQLTDHSASSRSTGVQGNLHYRIVAGDGHSKSFFLTVVEAPALTVKQVEYDYPEYTGYADQIITDDGHIRAIEGTKITLHARANGSIAEAYVDFEADGRRDLAMEHQDDTAKAMFALALRPDRRTPKHTCYALRMKNVEGRRNHQPVQHTIEVFPDYPPEVELRTPSDNVRDVQLNETVVIEVEARDPDFALSDVQLVGEVADNRMLDEKLLPEPRTGRFVGRFLFTPSRHGLQAGDRFRYWAIARDNRQPDPNVALTHRQQFRIVSPEPRQSENQDQLANRETKPSDSPGDSPAEEGQAAAGQTEGKDQADANPQDDGNQANNRGSQKSNTANQSTNSSSPPRKEQPQDPDDHSGNPDQEPSPTDDNRSHEDQQPQPGQNKQPGQDQPGQDQPGQDQPGQDQQGQDQQGQDQQGQDQQGQDQQGQDQQGQGGTASDQPGDSTGNKTRQGNQQPSSGTDDKVSDARAASQNGSNPSNAAQRRQPGQGGNPQDQPRSPVSPTGDDDGEAFERIRQHFQKKDASSQSRQTQPDASPDTNQQGESSRQDNSGEQPGKSDAQRAATSNEPSEDPSQPKTNTNPTENSPDQSPHSKQDESPGSGDPGAETRPGDPDRDGQASQEQNQEQSSPGGQQSSSKGPSGAGDQPDESQGAPSSDERMKPRDKWEQDPSDTSRSDDGEPPTPGAGKRESDSKGDQGGDRPGGGQEGGGQKADHEGTGSSGQNQSADEGGGESSERGTGNDSAAGAGEKQSSQPTGEPGDGSQGQGTKERQGQGDQPGGKPSSQAGNQNSEGTQQQATGEKPSADQRPGEPTGDGEKPDPPKDPSASGDKAAEQLSEAQDPRQESSGDGASGGGGKSGSNQGRPPQPGSGEPGGDEANLDYARRETELILNKLADLLNRKKVDSELLDQLGWTPNELKQFVDRWKSRREEANQSASDSTANDFWNNALRSLGFKPDSPGKGASQKDDTLRDLRDAARVPPPPEFEQRLRAYNQGVSKSAN